MKVVYVNSDPSPSDFAGAGLVVNANTGEIWTLRKGSPNRCHTGAETAAVQQGSALDAWPVGSVYLAVDDVSPATKFGGTWAALGAGKVLVGVNSQDPDFDVAEKTGGAKAVTPTGAVSQPTFTGTQASLTHSGAAVGDHLINQVINHSHAVTVTDPGHNHTQNPHSHVITSQTATTGSATSYEHGTLDTSSAEAEATETTANATATNVSATTGITASTANPAGGAASITLVHSVTQPSEHTYTPQGSVSQPTFTGNATSVVQPYIAVHIWKRTA